VGQAWDLLVDPLGGIRSDSFHALSHLIPPTADGLLDGSIFPPDQEEKQARILKPYLKMLSALQEDHYNSLTAKDKVDPSFTLGDLVVARSRSDACRIFAEPFNKRNKNTFTNDNYISFVRYFLGLPPVAVREAKVLRYVDYPVQACAIHPLDHLDAAACHAHNCTSGCHARNRKHNNIARVLAKAAKEAGLEATGHPWPPPGGIHQGGV